LHISLYLTTGSLSGVGWGCKVRELLYLSAVVGLPAAPYVVLRYHEKDKNISSTDKTPKSGKAAQIY